MLEKDKISYRVMKVGEFTGKNPGAFYKVICSCTDDKDTITFEIDHDWDMVGLSIYQTLMWSSYWGNYNWFQRMWMRIKASIKLLFIGEIEVEGELNLQGEEHVQGFIDALEEGKAFIKKWEEEEKIKENKDAY